MTGSLRHNPRVVISGYFGYNNAGDEAILTAMVGSLRRFVPGVEITVISGNPLQTAGQHRVETVGRADLAGIYKAVGKADLLLSGGGSILQDVTSSRSLLYYLGVVVLAQLVGTKVMFFAQGVGPIVRPWNRWLTAAVAKGVDLITVRETGSRETLENLGVVGPPVIVTADQVFALEPAAPERAREILVAAGVGRERPLVGIALRHWRQEENYKVAVARAADDLVARYGVEVVFLPLQAPADIPVAQEVAGLMTAPAKVLTGSYSAQELLAVTGELDLMVGMRLHALVFAAVQGVPMVGIVYDPKVADFVKLVNQPAAGTVETVTPEGLGRCVAQLWEDRRRVGQGLADQCKPLVEKAHENSRLVAQLLGR